MTQMPKMLGKSVRGSSPTVRKGVKLSAPRPPSRSGYCPVGLAALTLHGSQHQTPNQPTKGPHHKPVDAKLPPARVIATNYPCLSRQDRPAGFVFSNAEIPNGACESSTHRSIKIFTVKRGEIAGRAPESSGDS